MDKIHISDILLRCIIGVRPDERTEKQDVVVSVILHADLREAGATDDFTRTIDYSAVKAAIAETVERSEFELIEALAEAVALLCLSYDRVEQVDVVVQKPGALRFARTVAVEISRTRDDQWREST